MKYKWRVLFLLAILLFPVRAALADSVEIAEVRASYSHPLTGVSADAGNNDAIGQGMVESVLDPQALVEVDGRGQVYATYRFHLADQIGDCRFSVQLPGEKDFRPVQVQKMQTSGDAVDYRLPLPDKEAIVRVEARIKAMGREVVFYAQGDNFVPGNTDFIVSVNEDKAAADGAQEEAEPAPAAGAKTAAKAKAAGRKTNRNSSKAKQPQAKTDQNLQGPVIADDVGLVLKGDPFLEQSSAVRQERDVDAPYGFYTKMALVSLGLVLGVVCVLVLLSALVAMALYYRLRRYNDEKEAEAYDWH